MIDFILSLIFTTFGFYEHELYEPTMNFVYVIDCFVELLLLIYFIRTV